MTRTDHTHRSLFLVTLVVLAAAIGAVAVTGTVGAQDAGSETSGNETNASTANTTDESFYSPPEEDPLNARFRDGDGNTVESVAEGVLNLNIVNGMFDGPYDVEVTASDLSEEQVGDITFDNAADDTNDLDRTDIVGMDFSDVPAGEYEFTVTVVGEDATETLPLQVTGEDGATETPSNESATNETTEEPATNETATETGNETEMGAGGTDSAGNTSVTAVPSTANTSSNHTVSTVVGPNGAGNLTAVTVNYGESNVSIGPVLTSIRSASIGGESVINNTTTVTIGPVRQNLTINFDGTVQVSEGDQLNITYGGVTNPTEPGTYTVGVAVNNGTFDNATLAIDQNATAGNETEMGAGQMGNATGNTSITAMPSTANTSSNHTVSTVVGPNGAGNLTAVTVNYGESNVSIGPVLSSIRSASIGGESVINNSTTVTIGPFRQNLTLNFDGTVQVSEGDQLNITYGGVTNPTEPGTYTVGVAANNGTFDNATLSVTQNTTADNGTTQTTTTAQTTTAGTETGTGTGTAGGTAAGTAVETAVETAAGTDGGGGGGGQQGTDAGGPGFGIAVAVVALLAAALLAVRRN